MSRLALILMGSLFLSGCATVPVAGPTNATERTLRSADLQSDLALLERIYRTLHPGLYRYLSEAEVAALFAEGRQAFEHDLPLSEAFVEFTRLTARIQCGHSYPNFFNQDKATQASLFRGPRLPFHFRWLGSEMVVVRNGTDSSSLSPGTTVEAIGDVSTQEILKTMLPLARADGSNDAKRRAYLEVSGESEFEPFDIFLPILFPQLISSDGSVTLSLRSAEGIRSRVTVATQSQAERAVKLGATVTKKAPNAPLWELKMLQRQSSSIGYLAMPSWVAYQTKWDWQADLNATMAKLATSATPALIIDLRGNEGGSDVGDLILAHLIDAPMKRRTTVRRVRFATVPAELRPVLDTWDKSFFTLGAGPEVTDVGNGWREIAPDASFSDSIEPAAPHYRGKVIVLVDAANSSATFQFAAVVQRNKLGTLVGMPTGGSQRGINGGAFFFARLPATGIEVDVPLIGTFPAGPLGTEKSVPDSGITPEIVVVPTAQDIANGVDAQLERAIQEAIR